MMKKISRRSFLQVCGITAATAALTACGSGKAEGDKSSSQNGKIQITFYLWDRSMMKALTPWLEENSRSMRSTSFRASTPWTTTAIC